MAVAEEPARWASVGVLCGFLIRLPLLRPLEEAGGVVRQHQVEVGDVDVRLVPVDQRDPSAVMRMLPGLGSPWTTHR